jgi:hypothetical protein
MNRSIPTALAALFLFAAVPSRAEDDARNLYVEQLNKPSQHINSGINYWLELNKSGKLSHVSNKKTFHNGDKIRLHVKPNFSGYAYILMLQGSQGNHSVLFPSKKFPNNKITAGKEIALPVGNDGGIAWMKFDENPGKEVLRVICSRKPIDAKKQFAKDEDTVVIASSEGASDDTVPDGSVVQVESRNLSVVQSSKPPLTGSVTVVNHNPQKLLSVDITLNHQD